MVMPTQELYSSMSGRIQAQRSSSAARGRKNVKPPWYSVRLADPSRKAIEEFGNPRNIPRVADNGPPFIHDKDPRLYRPTINVRRVDVDAPPADRLYVPVDNGTGTEHGATHKLHAAKASFKASRQDMLVNRRKAAQSEVRLMMTGQAENDPKPMLFPYRVNHQMALALQSKNKTDFSRSEPRPEYKWDQTMYVPGSRTRRDFPHVKMIEQPPQDP